MYKGEGTILLVDDEEMIVDVGSVMLAQFGFKVLTARGGMEAIEVFEKKRNVIGLVILDMSMPGMGGEETYARLKEIDPNVKVILTSGYNLDGQAQVIMDKGCNGFMQKPFNLKELSRNLKTIFD